LRWKTGSPPVGRRARAFVWLDDETTDADRRWVRNQNPAKALVHRIDPAVGLADADFTVIRQWLAT
jgi:hypothetical protein